VADTPHFLLCCSRYFVIRAEVESLFSGIIDTHTFCNGEDQAAVAHAIVSMTGRHQGGRTLLPGGFEGRRISVERSAMYVGKPTTECETPEVLYTMAKSTHP